MTKHILVIDDDEDELYILQDALTELAVPHKCTWAENGSYALELLRSFTPDIIFLDVNMPYMNGLECLVAIKQLTGKDSIPVILSSTGMNQATVQQGLQAGAVACVKKANTFSELKAVLDKFLK